MVQNLKEQAARGIFWKFLDQGGTQLIQFISGIYIARLLSPEDYGLVGMMAIFLGVSQVFIDSGFKSTLIHRGDQVTQDDYTVTFYFNVGLSLLLYLSIFFSANAIANFYNEQRLIPIARILGLSLIISAFSIIQNTIFEKRLNFRTLTKVRLLAIFISVGLGIVMAMKGFGVWSLVVMMLSENFLRTTLLWFISRWVPSFSFNLNVFKKLWKQGSKLLMAGMLQQVSNDFFPFVIGKFYSTADVGFYSQGRKLQQRIGDFIVHSIFGVMFPVQSLMKDDIPRLLNSVRTNVKVTTLVAFPAIIGLIVIAEPFILLFLTEKWLPSVYYLQILSVAGLFFVLSGSISSFVLPMGKFNIAVIFSFVNLLLLVVLVFGGIFFHLTLKQLLLGKIIQDAVNLMGYAFYARKLINYKFRAMLKDAFPALLFSAIMGILIFSLGKLFSSTYITLLIQVCLGAIIYFLLNYFFNKKMMDEVKFFTRSFLKR